MKMIGRTKRMNISNGKVLAKLELVVKFLNEAGDSISYNDANGYSQDVVELETLNNEIDRLCNELYDMTGQYFHELIEKPRALMIKNKIEITRDELRFVLNRTKKILAKKQEAEQGEVVEETALPIETVEITVQYKECNIVKEVFTAGKRTWVSLNGNPLPFDNTDLNERLTVIREGILAGSYLNVEVTECVDGVPKCKFKSAVGDVTIKSIMLCGSTGRVNREFHECTGNMDVLTVYDYGNKVSELGLDKLNQIIISTVACFKAGSIKGFKYTSPLENVF